MARNVLNEDKTQVRTYFGNDEMDELFAEAVKIVTQYDRASASLLQRRLSIGYAKAARLLDKLEAAGVVSPPEGSEPREVLINSAENLKNIKPVKEKPIKEPVIKYTKPNKTIVTKPKSNPWNKSLYDVLNDKNYQKLDDFHFPLGYSDNELITRSLNEMSNLSITGNTLSNKEYLLDTIITSLILKLSHEKLKFILIDTTSYLSFYEGLPHLLAPLICDADKSVAALRWTLYEMDRRFKLFNRAKVREINTYNATNKKQQLPVIVIIINHFEHVFNYSASEVGDAVVRLASLGSKAGIHFILTCDRLTKTEVPIAFQSNITDKIFLRLTTRHDTGSTKTTGIDTLKSGEALLVSEVNNDGQRLETIYVSAENIKDIVKKITE